MVMRVIAHHFSHAKRIYENTPVVKTGVFGRWSRGGEGDQLGKKYILSSDRMFRSQLLNADPKTLFQIFMQLRN